MLKKVPKLSITPVKAALTAGFLREKVEKKTKNNPPSAHILPLSKRCPLIQRLAVMINWQNALDFQLMHLLPDCVSKRE